MNKVNKLRKRKVVFYLFMSPEELFDAITTSVLWKIHGSLYGEIRLHVFVLLVILIFNHDFV